MANLRADNLTGTGGRNAIDGALFFDGDVTGLQMNSSDFAFGVGDFTIEGWFNSSGSGTVRALFDTRSSDNFSTGLFVGINSNDNLYTYGFPSGTGVANYKITKEREWNHFAVVRNGSSGYVFLNGVKVSGSINTGSSNYTDAGGTVGQPSTTFNISLYRFKGYISNLRVVKTALYTADFIPPTYKLKPIENTVLLCCQDSDNPIQEATGKTITGFGRLQESNDTELVINSGFTNNISGWTASGVQWSHSSGALMHFGNGNTQRNIYQNVTTVVGKRYVARVLASSAEASTAYWQIAGATINYVADNNNSAQLEYRYYFTATSTSTQIRFYSYDSSNSSNVRSYWYLASIKLAPQGEAPKVLPSVGVDEGVTFEGDTKVNCQGYMYFPTGDTAQRGRGRGLIVANYIAPANTKVCEYVNIQSMGNSIKFGDASAAVRGNAVFASSTRAVSGSGYVAPSNVSTIEYFTIATTGNATNFGSLQGGNGNYTPISNETRGIFAGGYAYPSTFNNIDYVTIATTGDSVDFGGLTTLRADSNRTAVNSSTRGLIGGGYISPTGTNNIEFLTIATTGNSSDFGDLTAGRGNFTGLCSSTRGVFAGGTNPSNNIMDFVTIASAGNATDFGDMFTGNTAANCSTSNSIRGVIVGGDLQPSNAFTNTMQFVTIATTGDSQDFGDMLTVGAYRGMTSDSHGGLE